MPGISRPSLLQTEEWIPVRCQQESVGSYSQPTPGYTDHEVEQTPGIAAGKQDGKPGYHHANKGCNPQAGQDDIVRDS